MKFADRTPHSLGQSCRPGEERQRVGIEPPAGSPETRFHESRRFSATLCRVSATVSVGGARLPCQVDRTAHCPSTGELVRHTFAPHQRAALFNADGPAEGAPGRCRSPLTVHEGHATKRSMWWKTILVLAQTSTSATADTDPARLLTDVHLYYARTGHARARFVQRIDDGTTGDSFTSVGTVWLAVPNKLRWSYSKPGDDRELRTLVSDGKTTWMMDNVKNTVRTRAGAMVPTSVAFIGDTSVLAKSYLISIDTSDKYGSSNDLVLLLTPAQGQTSGVRTVYVIDSSDFMSRRL